MRAMDAQRLADNLERLTDALAAAAERSGRTARDVRLVAVTKTVELPAIRALIDLGHRDLGENRVQALVARAAALTDVPGLRWHMIGHLQRNKVRSVLPVAACIHAVDSERLAEEIQKVAAARDLNAEVMVEVNVSAESSKFGVAPDAAEALVERIEALPRVRCVGLMTMAPLIDAERTRPLFARLRALRDRIREAVCPTCAELSMGMTNDYAVAVEEGATVVRIGTAIFAGT
jgi:pyridoxal phosphate enzyme (YggS family)